MSRSPAAALVLLSTGHAITRYALSGVTLAAAMTNETLLPGGFAVVRGKLDTPQVWKWAVTVHAPQSYIGVAS